MSASEFITLVVDSGASIALNGVILYIVLQYFKMKKKEHLSRVEDKEKMLSASVTHRLITADVWSHSGAKLQLIKSMLIINSIERRPDEIEMKTRNILERQSSIYIEYFNSLNTPIDSIGDWYVQNFEFEKFFQEVMGIIFRKDHIPLAENKDKKERLKDWAVNTKIDDISNIMKSYQNRTGILLNTELKRREEIVYKDKTKFFMIL